MKLLNSEISLEIMERLCGLKKALIVTDIFKAFVAAALKQEYGITV